MSLHLFDGGAFRLAARTSGGRLEALAAERSDADPRWGEVRRARVHAFDRALGAAFLDVGDGCMAFLPCPEGEGRLRREDPLVVRIAAPARGGKLALARRADPDGIPAGPPAPVREAPGLLSRVTADGEAAGRVRVWPPPLRDRTEGAARVRGDEDDEALEALEGIAGLCRTELSEDAGLRLSIEPTAALVAIDVDGPGGGLGAEEGALRLGLAAAPEIARQTRLRNLAGLAVVDFVRPGSAAARGEVVAAVRRAFRPDPRVTRVGRMSPSGAVEIVRTREGPALHEVLGTDARGGGVDLRFAALLAELRIARAARTGARGEIEATASPRVAPLIAGDEAAAERIGRPVRVVADASLGDLETGIGNPG